MPVVLDAVRPDAVSISVQEEGIRTRRVARHVENGEQPDAVAHRDHRFPLLVVILQAIGGPLTVRCSKTEEHGGAGDREMAHPAAGH